MTQQPKFVVGITDHMIGQPEVEAEVLGPDVQVDFFDSTDPARFDPERLARLDALMVWGARLGADTIQHLTRCRGVVRYGVAMKRSTLPPWRRQASPLPTIPITGPRKWPITRWP